jgi:uncharacterized membrane protein YkoI
MIRKLCWLVGLALAVVAGGASLAWSWASEDEGQEKERKITLDQAPSRVKATILKAAGKSKIAEIEEITRGKDKFYEAAWIQDGKEIEVKVAPDGTLLGKEVEERKAEEEEEEKEGKAREGEAEREVTLAQVPPAAAAALKKLAKGAKITEFAEEIENGRKFYEGSWKTPSGQNVDVLVTAAGDLVEIEETVSANQAPAAVLAAARKAAGANADLMVEKKTMILYEAKFQKDGRTRELLLTPDGRPYQQETNKKK